MLKGEKVFLRPLEMADIEKTLAWRNDMFIKSSTMSHPFPITYEQEKEWYDNVLGSKINSMIYYAICEIKSTDIIGYIFLGDISWVSGNCFWGATIGDRDNIGKGFGKEAVLLVLRYAFEFLNMHKVYAHVLADHPALKTWLATGAAIEGTLKEHFWNGDKYHDVHVLAWYQ